MTSRRDFNAAAQSERIGMPIAEPEEHNYPAAESYLGLVFDEAGARRLVRKLRRAPLSKFKAKYMFRASGLPLLGVSNTQMVRNRKKIADGYHRLCAVYSFHEDLLIPCKIV